MFSHSLSRFRLPLIAGVLAGFALPLSGATTVLVEETFENGVSITDRWFWTGGQFEPTPTTGQAWNFNSTNNQFFTTAFSPTAIADGDKLTVTFNYNPSSANVRSIDVGLFSGTAATVSGQSDWNQYDTSSPSHTWAGFFGRIHTAGGDHEIFQRANPGDHPIFGANSLAESETASTISTGTLRAASLTLENISGDIAITLAEGADFDNLSDLVTNTVEGGATEFNVLAFYLRTLSGSGNGEVFYDNVTVTYSAIPEPSTYAGLFGLLALAMVLGRRR